MKKEQLSPLDVRLAEACREMKKNIKGALVTFTMFCMSSVGCAAPASAADVAAHVKISVPTSASSSVKIGDSIRVKLEEQFSRIESDSRREFRALGEWTSEAAAMERHVMKVASALGKVDYKQLVIDAAAGDDTFDYMLLLPDDTLVSLACTPAGLEEGLVGVSMRRGRKLVLASVVELNGISRLVGSFKDA